jgi:hypothetical protein
MAHKKVSTEIQLLLDTLDQAFDQPAWHGTNLRGSLKGLKLDELLYRPQNKRHCIWEIALHTAYWKYTIWRRIADAPKGAFWRKPSNFPSLPDEQSLVFWKGDLLLIEQEHVRFRELVSKMPKSALSKKPGGSKWSFQQLIVGGASHDLYHAGQIQLLKRMARDKK